jgi:ribosomal protein L12E/L44/L45/RPP1/RPP2
MGTTAIAIASIVSAVAAAGSAAYGIKRGEEEKGDASKAKKQMQKEAQKKKDMLKTKSPGQRLLGGRPTLG